MKRKLRAALYLIVSMVVSICVRPAAYAGDKPVDIYILPSIVLRDNAVDSGYDARDPNWRALVCNASTCELRSFDLDTDAQPASPAKSLKLVRGEFVLALFSGLPDAAPRTVPTWFTVRTRKTAADESTGSMGVRIPAGDNDAYNLIPRWNPKTSRLTFYLETKTRRQALGAIDTDAINAGIKTTAVLNWAGDLDGDGKIDLITGLGSDGAMGGIHLWLSSRAAADQIVSEVAHSYYQIPPSEDD